MIFKIFENRDVLQEIKYGLPSKQIMYTPSVIVIKNPTKDEYIVLKNRHRNVELFKLKIDDFEVYSTPYCKSNWQDGYMHLKGKNIIIDEVSLSKRGMEALHRLCV